MKTLGPFEGSDESNAAGLHHEVACQACLEIRRPAAPPTREQIVAEERAKLPKQTSWRPGMPTTIAEIQRIRAHALAEGGDSAVAKAPGRTIPKPWVPSVDDFDLLPDAEPHSSRYRR
jgi:hypothetical protein